MARTTYLTASLFAAAASLAAALMAFYTNGLMAVALKVLNWCESLIAICLPYIPLILKGLFWGAVFILASGIAFSLARAAAGYNRTRASLEKLPLADRGGTVALIKDGSIKTAFTFGLVRPRIYVSTGLIKSLSRSELRTVVLHEARHMKSRDPLLFFCIAAFKDMLYYVPLAAWFAQRIREIKEAQADAYSARRTGDPLGLAGAIVKVAKEGAGLTPAAASIGGDGVEGEVEGRVMRLIGGAEDKKWRSPALPSLRSFLSSAAVVALLVVALTLPSTTTASAGHGPECAARHHADVAGDTCTGHGKVEES